MQDNKAFKVIGITVIVAGLMAGAFIAGGVGGEKSSADPGPTATSTATVNEDEDELDNNLVNGQDEEAEEQDEPSGNSSSNGGNSEPSQPQQPAPQQPAPQQPAPPAPDPIVTPTPEPAPPGPVNQAPYIVSISPEDNAKGVKNNASVVVTFSEPMDKADVQAAFGISHGNPGTFTWNPAATVMTFKPGANLTYGTNVTVNISHTAADVDGLGMASDFSSKFKVLRELSTTLYSQPAYDGYVYAPGALVLGSKVQAGLDYIYAGTWSRGFLSFDLSGLPEDLDTILTAEVKVYQQDHHANAYTGDTGNLLISSVSYGALDVGDFSSPAFTYCNTILCLFPAPTSATLSSSSADGWKNINALGPVRSDWTNRAARGERSQFMLRFATENNGAGPSVWAKFTSGDAGAHRPLLTITYLAP